MAMTDGSLASDLTQAASTCNEQDLHSLITGAQSGRRVFTQLCLKGDIPFSAFPTLVAAEEPDLALLVAVTHGEWPSVLQLYEAPKVRARSRALAFQRATKELNWDAVVKMASSQASTHRQLRAAFYAAVTQGQLSHAYELRCIRERSFHTHDRVFALQECLRRRLWETAVEFTWSLSSAAVRLNAPLVSSLVAGASEDGQLSCCLELAGDFCSLNADRRFLRVLFTQALRQNEANFVFTFCRLCLKNKMFSTRRRPLRVATDLAVRKSRWTLLRKLSRLRSFRLSEDQFEETLTKSFKNDKTRGICAALLEKVLAHDAAPLSVKHLSRRCMGRHGEAQSQWCFTNSYYNLSLLWSLASQAWTVTLQAVVKLGGSCKPRFLHDAFTAAYGYSAVDEAAALLGHMHADAQATVSDFIQSQNDPSVCRSLATKCKDNGRTDLAVVVAAASRDWVRVQDFVRTNRDPAIVEYAVTEAARQRRWELVESMLHTCCDASPALGKALTFAVQEGKVELARILMDKTDPRVHDNPESLLRLALRSRSREMVALCIEAGLSHHECDRHHVGSFSTAVLEHDLPFVKLLHESGVSTNVELFRLASNQWLTSHLTTQGRLDVSRYLKQIASSPRSLQSMCRLIISRLIGCHPGRESRIASLPVFPQAKELIRFSDILGSKTP